MTIVTKAFVGAIALYIAIQFVPYGRNHAGELSTTAGRARQQ